MFPKKRTAGVAAAQGTRTNRAGEEQLRRRAGQMPWRYRARAFSRSHSTSPLGHGRHTLHDSRQLPTLTSLPFMYTGLLSHSPAAAHCGHSTRASSHRLGCCTVVCPNGSTCTCTHGWDGRAGAGGLPGAAASTTLWLLPPRAKHMRAWCGQVLPGGGGRCWVVAGAGKLRGDMPPLYPTLLHNPTRHHRTRPPATAHPFGGRVLDAAHHGTACVQAVHVFLLACSRGGTIQHGTIQHATACFQLAVHALGWLTHTRRRHHVHPHHSPAAHPSTATLTIQL